VLAVPDQFGMCNPAPFFALYAFDGKLRDKLGITGPLMIDSGGFALLMNPRAKWTVGTVGDLIAKIDGQIFVNLDLPPHTEDNAESRRRKIRRSNTNFDILSARFPEKTIMPVIHGRTLRELAYSVESLFKSTPAPEWVGLGGIVPLLKNRSFPGEISRMGAEAFIAIALRATVLQHTGGSRRDNFASLIGATLKS
jgi:hypothetical protein